MKYLILLICLSLFGTLTVCASCIVSARKNGQLRANRSFARWLKRQRDGRVEFTNTEPMRLGTLPALAKDAEAPKGLGRDGYEPLMRNRTANDGPSPIGNAAGSTLRKEVINNSPQRATDSESGAQNFQRTKPTWKELNPHPNGIWASRKIN